MNHKNVSPQGNPHRVFVGVFREARRPNQRQPIFGLSEAGKLVDPPLCANVGMFGEPVELSRLVLVSLPDAPPAGDSEASAVAG